jgi:hypothetical protein
MQYFQGPKTKQIRGRSRLLLADVVVLAVAAEAVGAMPNAPLPTVAAASAVSASILILFIVSLLFAGASE